MALDPNYILSPPIDQYFVNKDTGQPLSNGTLTFYRDNDRITGKTVYQMSGTPPNYTFTALPNPVTLSAVGTIENASGDNVALYFYPFDEAGNVDLYYIVARDEDGVEQFTREAFPANTAIEDIEDIDTGLAENQLSNPQFSRVFLNEGLSITYDVSSSATEQMFALAPDWFLLITGDGAANRTVVVQRIAVTGNQNFVTNMPYVLDIVTSAGISSCKLVQRLNTNSGLWTSTTEDTTLGTVDVDVYLAASITGLSFTTSVPVSMYYQESSGANSTTPVLLLNKSLTTTGYVSYEDISNDGAGSTIAIPASTNTDSGVDAWAQIYVTIPASSHVRISSIQVIPTFSPVSLPYDVRPSNREQALMGDYFIPKLEAKQIPSLLTGWDFPMNPGQFGNSGNIAGTPAYILDQTIAARGSSGNVAFAKSTITGGLQFTTAGTNDGFYILQYLSGAEAKKIVGSKLSVNVFGYKGTVGSDVTMRVYLYRGSSAATIPTLPTTLGTLAASGAFTLTAANWTAIPRGGLDVATATLNTIDTATSNWSDINDAANDYGFSQWEMTNDTQIGDTDKFAIVVSFGYITAATVITINSISVVPGEIPCRPGLQSASEALRDCRYYYEKSYVNATTPGTVTDTGVVMVPAPLKYTGGGNNALTYHSFPVKYESKRTAPTLTFYSPQSATIDRVRISGWAAGAYTSPQDLAISNWTETSKTVDSAWLSADASSNLVTFAEADSVEGLLLYHYIADARLGIV